MSDSAEEKLQSDPPIQQARAQPAPSFRQQIIQAGRQQYYDSDDQSLLAAAVCALKHARERCRTHMKPYDAYVQAERILDALLAEIER